MSHPHTNNELSFLLTTIPCYKALDVTAIEIVKICIQVTTEISQRYYKYRILYKKNLKKAFKYWGFSDVQHGVDILTLQ